MEAAKYLTGNFYLSYAQQILRNPFFNQFDKQGVIKSYLVEYF